MNEPDLLAAYGMAGQEDDLLEAIGDALTVLRRPWHHDRRSDLARTMGATGFPDVLAVDGEWLLAWELKSARGQPTSEQLRWIRALSGVRRIDARVVRPVDLDGILAHLTRGRTV